MTDSVAVSTCRVELPEMMAPIRRQLSGDPIDVEAARLMIMKMLHHHPSVVFVRDAVLLTGELATNAKVHAGGHVHIQALFDYAVLRVEATDASDELPVINVTRPRSPAGQGLALIADVSDRWGTQLRAIGKTVWFELDDRDLTERPDGGRRSPLRPPRRRTASDNAGTPD